MIKINQNDCIGCATCVNICPHHVIEIEKNEKKAYLSAEERCIECGACKLNCPAKVIEVSTGSGCLLHIIKEAYQEIFQPKLVN